MVFHLVPDVTPGFHGSMNVYHGTHLLSMQRWRFTSFANYIYHFLFTLINIEIIIINILKNADNYVLYPWTNRLQFLQERECWAHQFRGCYYSNWQSQSVRNRCVIELLGCVFLLWLSFQWLLCWYGAFVIGLSRITSFFFSLQWSLCRKRPPRDAVVEVALCI